MKYTLYALLVLSIFSCNTITLNMQLRNNQVGGEIRIEKVVNDELTLVESIVMDSLNYFSMDLEIEEPGLYRLSIFNEQYINLILNDEDVNVVADGVRNGSFDITGSVDNDHLLSLGELMGDYNGQLESYNDEFQVAQTSDDSVKILQIQSEYLSNKEAFDEQIREKIRSMGNSIAALISLQFIDPESNFPFFEEMAAKFEKNLPNSPYTKSFVTKVNDIKKLAIGSEAPEISLPDPMGNIISLSSLRGNYVLIDFWAGWCKPCRQENPNVVRLYNEYNSKGFEVFGVSLDRKRSLWVKAIEEDGLTWAQVSDLKYFLSDVVTTYKISGIPATYLIGPDGKIIAKNLRGPSLEAKLKEIFG